MALAISQVVQAETPITWQLADSQGHTQQFPVAKGQTTILFFWATWCPYCKQLMPHIQSALYQYEDELNLQVYALNIKEDGDANAYMREHGYTFRLFPEADAVAEQYRIWGTPGVLIFDAKGELVFDLRSVQSAHRVKKNASHGAKSVRLGPYWAAEIRKALAKRVKSE